MCVIIPWMVLFLLDAITLLIFSPIFWGYLLHLSWSWGSSLISSLLNKDNDTIQIRQEHLQMSFLNDGMILGPQMSKYSFPPDVMNIDAHFLDRETIAPWFFPRLDLTYHEHMWMGRKKMIIIDNLAFINIVNSKEHKLSQEQWLTKDNGKYNMSIFLKVVKNKLEAIPIPIQDDFFYCTCLPLLRSNLSQQSLGVHLRKQWGRLYWLPPTLKHTTSAMLMSYFWCPGEGWSVAASESMRLQ